MKNLFDPATKQEIIARINLLTPTTQSLWGKMAVAQMLKHLTMPLNVALTNPKPSRSILGRILGPIAKSSVIGSKPFKRGSYTPPEFKIETHEDFNMQKTRVLDMVNRFTPENVADKIHPFFGRLSDDEWGQSQYKHFDHHLSQFDV